MKYQNFDSITILVGISEQNFTGTYNNTIYKAATGSDKTEQRSTAALSKTEIFWEIWTTRSRERTQ